MQKIKDFLLSVNFNVAIFVLVGLRIAVFGASIGDALAIVALAALKGYVTYLEHHKEIPLDEQLREELNAIKANMSGIMIKNSVRPPSNPDQGMKKFF